MKKLLREIIERSKFSGVAEGDLFNPFCCYQLEFDRNGHTVTAEAFFLTSGEFDSVRIFLDRDTRFYFDSLKDDEDILDLFLNDLVKKGVLSEK